MWSSQLSAVDNRVDNLWTIGDLMWDRLMDNLIVLHVSAGRGLGDLLLRKVYGGAYSRDSKFHENRILGTLPLGLGCEKGVHARSFNVCVLGARYPHNVMQDPRAHR
ncbi:hypothetical protein HerbRD11066_31950 [Herbidospora sp. RD11066]